MSRFQDALFIQDGACNPSGMAHALVKACKECLDEGVSQREDPAVKLIVHQIAYIVLGVDKFSPGQDIGLEYSRAMERCREMSKVKA